MMLYRDLTMYGHKRAGMKYSTLKEMNSNEELTVSINHLYVLLVDALILLLTQD